MSLGCFSYDEKGSASGEEWQRREGREGKKEMEVSRHQDKVWNLFYHVTPLEGFE